MIYPTCITRLAFFFVVPIIPKICWRQKIRNFWLLWYFDNHLAQNFIYTFHFHDSVMHKYTGLGSLSSQTQYLPLRNYFIKYPPPPPQIYVTMCNKIVDPSPLWTVRNFWTAPTLDHDYSYGLVKAIVKTICSKEISFLCINIIHSLNNLNLQYVFKEKIV